MVGKLIYQAFLWYGRFQVLGQAHLPKEVRGHGIAKLGLVSAMADVVPY